MCDTKYYIVLIVFMLLEFYLGKTTKVKANSTIEIILWLILKIGRIVWKKQK